MYLSPNADILLAFPTEEARQRFVQEDILDDLALEITQALASRFYTLFWRNPTLTQALIDKTAANRPPYAVIGHPVRSES